MPDDFFSKLQRDRDAAFATAERILDNAKRSGRDTLSEIEQRRFDDVRSTMLALDKRMGDVAAEDRRGVLPPHLQHLTKGRPKAMFSVNEPRTYRRGQNRRRNRERQQQSRAGRQPPSCVAHFFESQRHQRGSGRHQRQDVAR